MDTLQTNRIEIPLGIGMRTLYTVLGIFFLVLGIIGAYALTSSQPSSIGGLALLAFVAVAVYTLALAFRSRVLLEGPRITVRGAFKERTATLDEIAGLRTISSRNGNFWSIELRDARGAITVQKSFANDDLNKWLAKLPDLDERDRQQVLDEISANQELGATPEERLAALKRALWVNIGLTTVTFLSALSFAIAPDPFRSLGAYVIAIVPLVIIYLLRTGPLLYAVFKLRRDPRTELSLAFLASAFGLFFGMREVHLVGLTPLLPWMAVIAIGCGFGMLPALKNRTQMFGIAIALLMFVGFYAYGFAAAADSLLDRSAPSHYQTTVTDMHISHGKSTSYHLQLFAPWGPVDQTLSVSIPHERYNATQVGGTVCLDVTILVR